MFIKFMGIYLIQKFHSIIFKYLRWESPLHFNETSHVYSRGKCYLPDPKVLYFESVPKVILSEVLTVARISLFNT